MPKFPLPAGEGETEIYPIHLNTGSIQPFQKDEHYVAISASSMFVNKQSNWLSQKSVTGLISIKVGNQEEMKVALNCYELENGQRRSPFTNKELMPVSKYTGGNIKIVAYLNGLKKDKQLKILLSSAADASLGIVKSMAMTPVSAALSPLQAAGSSLIDGVKNIITDHSDKDFTIFDPKSGYDHTIDAASLKGDEFYVLLHRGSKLDKAKVSVLKDADIEYAQYDGQPLEDGAWILLQINRVKDFPFDREWKPAFHQLRDNLHNLITDVFDTGLKTAEEAKKEFKTSEDNRETISDKFVALRKTIQSDQALIENEKKALVAVMTRGFVAAKNAIEKNDRSIFDKLFEEMKPGSSKVISEETKNAFAETMAAISSAADGGLLATKGLELAAPRGEEFSFENLLNRKTAMSFFETPSK